MKRIIIIIIVIISITKGCDTYNYIRYAIQNNTSDSLSLELMYHDNYFSDFSDTIISITPNSTDTVYTYIQISPKVYDPEYQENMVHISNASLERIKDNKLVLKDISLRENWIYNEFGDHIAELVFIVNDEDF